MIRKIKDFVNKIAPNFYMKLFKLKNEILPKILFNSLRKKRKGTLVYVGMNVGDEFGTLYYKFERCIGIEANPENYKKLINRFSGEKNVEIYNYAASIEDDYINGSHVLFQILFL